MILAGIGRYGPYLQHSGVYANLSNVEEVFDVGLNRAVDLLAEKRAGGRGPRTAAAALAELGNHPVSGKPVRVLSGRFGPYIKHESTNANVPKGADPAAITLEDAVALLTAREAAGGGKKPVKRKAASPAKATARTKAKAKPTAKAKAPAKRKTVKAGT